MKPDFGRKPSLDWLDVDTLTVDAKYQRDTGSRRSRIVIDTIKAGFKWSRFGIVSVVRSGDGFHVVDGQHRVEASRALGIPKIPAVVLPHATLEAAAADFVAINRDRVTVTPLHIHHAMLAAGDPVAEAIAKACKAGGVDICRYPVPAANMKPGQTLAIGTIGRLVKQHGWEFAGDVLGRVRKGTGGGRTGRRQCRRHPGDGWFGLRRIDGRAAEQSRGHQAAGLPAVHQGVPFRRAGQPVVHRLQAGI